MTEFRPGIDPIETELTRCLAETAPQIVAAYLFGSVARGTATAASDVDVAVLFAADPEPTFPGPTLELEGTIEARLRRPVEVIELNRAPVDLIHRVLRDGHLLLERNRAARIRFEIRARNEYFDLLPFLRRYRRLAP